MNIKERLINECTETLQGWDNRRGNYTEKLFDKTKFYESIVQECLLVLRARYMGDNNREDMEVKRCMEDVKKHFNII